MDAVLTNVAADDRNLVGLLLVAREEDGGVAGAALLDHGVVIRARHRAQAHARVDHHDDVRQRSILVDVALGIVIGGFVAGMLLVGIFKRRNVRLLAPAR